MNTFELIFAYSAILFGFSSLGFWLYYLIEGKKMYDRWNWDKTPYCINAIMLPIAIGCMLSIVFHALFS